jgi:GntR family transcriptional regulator/MocR family aminotransferase
MDLHLVLDREAPLRAQLERELRDAIRSGRLRAKSKLPPSRVLAGELDVSRGVVVEAYAQLVAEGYLIARPGDGTRVAEAVAQQPPARRAPAAPPPRVRYDLRSGVPDLSFFPRREWHTATAAVLHELPDVALTYGSRHGRRPLRDALSEYLGRVRAVVADPERMFISSGSVHAQSILWHALRERGARRIAVEDPVWPRIPETVSQAGLSPVAVGVDGDGLRIDELERADVDAVVVSPAHQYPTGVVMGPRRRAGLIAWARHRGALIVEDDYDAEYRYDREPVAALQGMAPDCVAYAGTTSKTLAPGLRLAWILVPTHLVGEMAAQMGVAYAVPNVIVQDTYARLLQSGVIDRHLRRTRRRYRTRRDVLAGAFARLLPEVRLGGASAGLHLIGWLPDGAEETAIAERAAARGVAIHTLHRDCAVTGPTPPALLLGYGSITDAALPHAVEELAHAVQL